MAQGTGSQQKKINANEQKGLMYISTFRDAQIGITVSFQQEYYTSVHSVKREE